MINDSLLLTTRVGLARIGGTVLFDNLRMCMGGFSQDLAQYLGPLHHFNL
jgi:hypothetical protein